MNLKAIILGQLCGAILAAVFVFSLIYYLASQ